MQWRGVQAPCEHVPQHPAALYSDCRVPEQSGEMWRVLQLLYKLVQKTNRASRGFPSRRRGTDPFTHLCCALREGGVLVIVIAS